MKEKYFRIGELSNLFNIGVDSIRYYEKVGILHPVRSEENNYRLYSFEDVRKLTMIRELLNLNFSTEQIKNYDEQRTVQDTISLLKDEMSVIDEQISSLCKIKHSIQTRLDNIHQHLSIEDLESIQVLFLKARPCVMVSSDNLPDDHVDYYLVKYMHSMQDTLDTIGACDCYTLDLEHSNPASLYYRTKNVFFYSESLTYQSNYELPEGTYLSLVYQGPLSKTKELLPRLYTYAKEHGYQIISDPIEFCFIDDYETEYDKEYVTELQLRVSRP